MSAISLKSITGITSITTPTGVDNQLTLHTNDTTQRVKVTQSGVEIAGVTTITNASGTNTFKASNNGIQLYHNHLKMDSLNQEKHLIVHQFLKLHNYHEI